MRRQRGWSSVGLSDWQQRLAHKSTIVSLSVHRLQEAGWLKQIGSSILLLMHGMQHKLYAQNDAFNNRCPSYRYWWCHFKPIPGTVLIRREVPGNLAVQFRSGQNLAKLVTAWIGSVEYIVYMYSQSCKSCAQFPAFNTESISLQLR